LQEKALGTVGSMLRPVLALIGVAADGRMSFIWIIFA
jgi:hypothetical protein